MNPFYCQTGKLCLYVLFLFILQGAKPVRGQGTEHTFQGRVLSATDREPLPGASVYVKGSRQGTTTDSRGEFTYTTSDSRVALRISFIGYHALDTLVSLPLAKELVLALSSDEAMLEEVKVSTGYWESSKRMSTGNISKITAETIEKQPVGNPLAAMIGRLPGVQVTQNTGVPGGGFTVRIRGRNSLRVDGNEPLYIIDGVPFTSTSIASPNTSSVIGGGNPLNALNPGDIASIEVLKDADATAIYGSRGANGVILITTKKNQAEKPRLDLSFSQGLGTVSSKMKMLDNVQYEQMRREAFSNDGLEPTAANAYDIMVWDTGRNTNWQKELIGKRTSQTNAKLSFAGGNQETHFLLGAGYFRDTAVFPGKFSDTKYSGHFNMSHQTGSLELQLFVNMLSDQNNLPQTDLTFQALTLPPNAPALRDPATGELNWGPVFFDNPLGQLLKKYYGRTFNLISNIGLTYRLAPSLHLKGNFGYTRMEMKEITTSPIASNNPFYGLNTGSAIYANGNVRTWIAEPQLSYSPKVGIARMNILLGATIQENQLSSDAFRGSGFTSDALLENLKAAPTVSVYYNNYNLYRYVSWYTRVNLNLDSKYIINLTARRDGSTRFGPSARFANFGSVGMAWLFRSQGDDQQFLSPVNSGKLRASFGITGSDQIGDYQYMDTYGATSYPYQGIPGVFPTKLSNQHYGWESNRKAEVAADLGLWNNRATFSVAFFHNRASRQLVGFPLPPTTGFTSILDNRPAIISNSGLEVEVGASLVKGHDFEWTADVNFTRPWNKLVAYPGIESSPYANTYSVGKAMGYVKAYHTLGVDPQTGVLVFEDFNGNGLVPEYPGDLQALKKVGPQFYGGISNRLVIKRFEVDFLCSSSGKPATAIR